jgi:hypothetical protein
MSVSTGRGRAIPPVRSRDLAPTTEGLREVTFEVLGGSHLELVMRCRYVDSGAARRAATVARVVIASSASRGDFATQRRSPSRLVDAATSVRGPAVPAIALRLSARRTRGGSDK